jgi:hypothetical protein
MTISTGAKVPEITINDDNQKDLSLSAIFAPKINDYSLVSGTTIENLMSKFGIILREKNDGLFSFIFRATEKPVTWMTSSSQEMRDNIGVIGTSDSQALKLEFAKALKGNILLVPTDYPGRPRRVYLGEVTSEG